MLRLLTPFALLFTLALAFCPISAWADEDRTVPEADYWRVIAAIETVAAGESNAPTVDASAAFGSLADELASISTLELDSGAVIPIDHSFLLARLRANPPDAALIHDLASALLAARSEQGPPIFTAADVASLGPILARTEFRYLPRELPEFVR